MQESDATARSRSPASSPAAYSGRWPHIHFEVYESLAAATVGRLEAARPRSSPCPRTPATSSTPPSGYEQSVENLAQTSLDTDNVFSDGYAGQLATTSGTVDSGIAVKLNVGV